MTPGHAFPLPSRASSCSQIAVVKLYHSRIFLVGGECGHPCLTIIVQTDQANLSFTSTRLSGFYPSWNASSAVAKENDSVHHPFGSTRAQLKVFGGQANQPGGHGRAGMGQEGSGNGSTFTARQSVAIVVLVRRGSKFVECFDVRPLRVHRSLGQALGLARVGHCLCGARRAGGVELFA